MYIVVEAILLEINIFNFIYEISLTYLNAETPKSWLYSPKFTNLPTGIWNITYNKYMKLHRFKYNKNIHNKINNSGCTSLILARGCQPTSNFRFTYCGQI